MIVLTGATGGIGSQVLKHLLQTCYVPPTEIALSIYNPNTSSSFLSSLPEGIQVRRGDFLDPASLDEAFKGAEKLLIVSYPSIAYDIRVKAHKNAIDAAKRAGVKHIWYTSLAFGGKTGVGKKGEEVDGEGKSVSAVMQAHLGTEKFLKESGITYTILREGHYAESYPLYLGASSPCRDLWRGVLIRLCRVLRPEEGYRCVCAGGRAHCLGIEGRTWRGDRSPHYRGTLYFYFGIV